ncbi:MAG TPA: ribbon-helix-helix protein, CopG family [Gemmatimonadota bacterium]|nr:ribbon-helix-helix protein, CopG family [Gemmatimonadota bacterium]
MKEKTSITLSRDVLEQVDRLAGEESRSSFIERVLRGYLGQRARAATNARDLKRLNRAAGRLNAEASEVLGYQASWPEE